MARYCKELAVVDYPEKTLAEVRKYLASQKFVYRQCDGEWLFQKGKGFWVAPSFLKVTYSRDTVRVEAWIDAFGSEQDLEGFVGVAAKKPLKKVVTKVEEILCRPGVDYAPTTGEIEDITETAEPRVETPVAFVTKKKYFKKYASESFYRNLRVTAIVGYVLCGISVLTAIVNPFALVDVAIYLSLLLGMHLGKSKGCAIGVAAYAILGVVVNLVLNGVLVGWGWLIIGIYSLVIFNNAEKRYKSIYGA